MKEYRTTTINKYLTISYTNYSYVMIGLIVIGLIGCFFGFMQCDQYSFSVCKGIMAGFTDHVDESVSWIFRRFFIVCVVFMTMHIIECLLLIMIRDVYVLIIGWASLVLNGAITIMIMRLGISAIDELTVLGHQAWMKPLPFVIWVLVYVLMIAAGAIMFWWIYRNNKNRNIYKEDDKVIIEEIYK